MKLQQEQIKQVTVHAVFEDEPNKITEQLSERDLFHAKAKSHYAMLDEKGEGTILFGLGPVADLDPYRATHYFYLLGKLLQDLKVDALHLDLPDKVRHHDENGAKAFEGLYQAEYNYQAFKTNKDALCELSISVNDYDAQKTAFYTVEKVVRAAFIARDLVNQPANKLYPETLADQVVALFADLPVEVTVHDRSGIEALGMEAYLNVHAGSDKEPRLIVMSYQPNTEDSKHITLVGKGMTYDSGGYAIKPARSMVDMKSDMAGAAAVIGAIHALATTGVKQNVVGIIAAAENLINGSAYKNGDIIGSMKGTTIEVNNTDAEGRLTLADALYYGVTQFNTKAIVDLATLTGAAIVALGEHTTALMSNDEVLAEQILTASERGCEPTQRLYAFPHHYDAIKGQFADLNNAPGGGGGAITAGTFLEQFVEGTPWVHLDIAGPSFGANAFDYLPAGASGTGVKTLYRWIAAL